LIERPIAIDKEMTRRPDRVVWTCNGEVNVIDYKTGSQSPEKYRKQVKEYVTILNSLGYENVTGYLYYLDSGKIVRF
ncbi:MAG: PD-(D/E)XK nuclease family protein, partial [Duncaniella sp.]|nr:PD-(D/E)XK nuclease family protein [Duncaniella sp.]